MIYVLYLDLRALFKGIEVEAFIDVEGVLAALEDGRYPQAIFLDSSYGGWKDEKPNWATDNAKAIISWFEENAPDKMPSSLMFQSADPPHSKRCAETIGIRTDTNITHCDKFELKLSVDLVKGLKTDYENAVTTSFRELLKKHTGISLPMTVEEIVRQGFRHNSYDRLDIIKLANEGFLDLETALKLLRPQAISSAENDLRPRAVVPAVLDLKSSFKQAAGNTARGHAAFSLDEVNELAEDGKKAILYLEEYDPRIIPHLGKISGVVILDNSSSGHIRSVLNSHGVAGAIGASAIDQSHPYLRSPDGEKIIIGQFIQGKGKDRAFIDCEPTLKKLGDRHLAKLEGDEVDLEQAPPLSVDIEELEPAVSIKFGDPITMDIINQNVGPNIYDMHLDIIESQNGAHEWLPEVRKLLEKWQDDNGIEPLTYKAIIDHAGQNYKGADGIGLLRTKHFIMETEVQIHAYRKALLEEDEGAFEVLQEEFKKTLVEDTLRNAKPGEPVCIRLVDLPLSELFSEEEAAQIGEKYGEKGIRGAQLGMALPKLYEAQFHAIFSAAREDIENRAKIEMIDPSEVIKPKLEVMISNTRVGEEIDFFGDMAENIAAQYGFEFDDFRFGSMLETVSAGRHIEDIAPFCDFLKVGSNDASSEILIYERHDLDRRNEIMKEYGKKFDPAIMLYPPVIEWIEDVTNRAKKSMPGIEIEICGDHAADIDSLNALRHLGLSGVSVAPNNQNLIGLKVQYAYETFDRFYEDKPELATALDEKPGIEL